MPTYTIKAPTGQNISVTGAKPPSEQELDEIFAKVAPAQGPAPVAPAPEPEQLSPEIQAVRDIMRDPNSGPIDRLGAIAPYLYYKGRDVAIDAGIRGAPPTLGQAIGQRVAGPLGKAVGGFVGGIAGDVGADLYEGKAPRLGSALGAGLVGAMPNKSLAGVGGGALLKEGVKQGAANLAATALETGIDAQRLPSLSQAAQSAIGGVGSTYAGKAVGKVLGAKGPRPTETEKLYGAGPEQSFRALRGEGVKVLPQSLVGRGGDTIGALGQRTTLQREIDLSNQEVWQKLARAENGLSKEARPLFHTELDAVRDGLTAPYEEIKDISARAQIMLGNLRETKLKAIGGHDLAVEEANIKHLMNPLVVQAAADVDSLKIARNLAQKEYAKFAAGDPAAYAEWQKQVSNVAALNDQIVEAAKSVRNPDLVKRLNKAREGYAISYATQEAVASPRGGLVDPVKFALIEGRQPGYLTGNLRKMADFALDHKRDAVEASRLLPPGVNNMALQQQFQMASSGNPLGAALAATSKFAGYPLRTYQKSNSYQNRLAQPNMKTGAADFAETMARLSVLSGARQEPMFNFDASPR